MSVEKWKKRAIELIDSQASQLINVSHIIHEFSELGYEEYKSSALLVEELKKGGFMVEKPVAKLETAFAATQGNGNPVIGILAEYDALPELGHGCGHNTIGTAAVGAGLVLGEIMKEYGIKGTVKVFGCPCEEGFKENAGGKIHMLKAGVFDGVEVSMMVHPTFGKYGVWSKALAREHLIARFTGRRPSSNGKGYDIVNALDAAVLMLNGIYILKQRKRPDSVITYIISEGGVNPNIIPLNATVRLYIRSLTSPYLNELVEKIKEVAQGAALMTGCKVEFKSHTPTYEASVPNLVLSRQFQENLQKLGVEVEEPKTSADKTLKGENTASTDYGNVSREIPSGTISISFGSAGAVLHTERAVEAAKSSAADAAMLIGVKALVMSGIDFLARPELVEEAREELRRYKKSGYQHPYPSGNYPHYIP